MAVSPFSIIKNKIIFLICWLLITLLQFAILHEYSISLVVALTDSLVSNILLASVGLLLSNTLQFYRPSKNKYLYLVIWCFAICALWGALVKLVLTLIFKDDAAYLALLNRSLPIRFNIALLITGCISLISVLWYNLEEQQLNEQRKTDTEALAREAELYTLRQQLQPHFLFNSLNSISALAGSKPEQARQMIQQLSDFLRGTLRKEETQWVTVEDELAHLQLYLEIEKVRFAHRLNTAITTDEVALGIKIPPMILQPIVENAIKFGLYDTIDDILIEVDVRMTKENLVITVKNPFDAETSSPVEGTGFGLRSLQRRLYLVFARNDLLETSSEKNIFITTIKIPQADDKNDNH